MAESVPDPRIDPLIPELLSITEVAEALGKTRQGVNWLVQQGYLRGRKVGSVGWVFRREAVDEYLNHNRD